MYAQRTGVTRASIPIQGDKRAGSMRTRLISTAAAVCLSVGIATCLAAGGGGGAIQKYEVEPAPAGAEDILVEEKDYDKDGAKELRVENRLMRLIFEPEVGGVIGSLILKKHGSDLTNRRGLTIPGGLLSDKLDRHGYSVDWNEAKYDYEVEKGPGRVSVTLSSRGKSGVLAYLTFRKRVTIERDSTRISVDYELHNHEESGSALTHGIWFHNMAGGPIRETSLFFPMAPGIMRFDPKEMTAHDAWLREPARGWTAVIEEKQQTGLAARVEYRYLKLFYTWFFNYPRCTWEWRFLPNPIPQGESFRTKLSFLPFAGLGKVNGATGEVVGSLRLTTKPKSGSPTKIETKLCGARDGWVDVLLRARRLPAKQWTTVGEKSVRLKPVESSAEIFEWTPPKDGTYVVQAVVRTFDKQPCILEEPAYVGKASAVYEMEPECERVSAEPIFDPRKVDLSFTSLEVGTPHIKWAKPYAGGRPEVAFFPAGIQIAREVVEMAQRFDIEPFTSVNILGSAQHSVGEYYGKLNPSLVRSKVNALLNPDRDYDTLVLSGDTWDHLTDFSRTRIREMVRDGAGLVWIDPSAKDEAAFELLPVAKRGPGKQGEGKATRQHFITRGVPFDAMPGSGTASWQEVKGEVIATTGDLPLIVLGEFGKGRVVILNYAASGRLSRGLLPRTYAYPDKLPYPYWEYQYSLLGRAVLWVSKSEPETFISTVTTARSSESGKDGDALIIIVDTEDGQSIELTAEFYDEYGERFHGTSKKLRVGPGENRATLLMPSLQTGKARAHVFLRTKRGTMDWFVLPLESSAPRVTSVELDQEAYDRGDTVRATTVVEGTPAEGSKEAGLVLQVCLLDGYGRLVAQQRAKVEPGGKTETGLPLSHMISTSGIVEARLYAGRQIDRKQARFIVRPPREWDEFETITWAGGTYSGGHESLYDARMRRMKLIGMTGIVQNPYDYRPAWIAAFADNNMKIVTKGSAKNSAQHGAKYGALLNMYGDERSVGEVTTPEGVALIRAWLKSHYPSLQALNQEWDTDYQKWDDVAPMLKLEQAIARNREKGFMNFAPWADYRLYLTHKFADKFRREAAELTEVDPRGRMGISGTQAASTKSGNDWWMLTNTFKALQNYGRSQLHKSFVDIRLAPWAAGYGRRGPRVRVRYWESLFQGCSGCSSWCEQTLINPDFTLFQGAVEGKLASEEIRRGPGKLLMHCRQLFDPVAFHYSQTSLHGAHALGKEKSLNASRNATLGILGALGYQPSHLAYEQVERGDLTPEKTKLFFMPHSFSISAEEAERIRSYVLAGGVVVADLLPGVMNEHCRAYHEGQLDDVFGVKRKKVELKDVEADLVVKRRTEDLALPGGPISTGVVEPSLRSDGAKALGEAGGARAVIVNRYGRGRAIYLNGDFFSRYRSWAQNRDIAVFRERTEAAEALMGAILSLAGCRPRARVTLGDGSPSRSCSVYAFTTGRNLYLGAIGGAREPEAEGTIAFPWKAFTYEVITGRPFGYAEAVAVELGPRSVHLFALLSYEVTGLSLDSPRAIKRGEVLRAPVRVGVRDGQPELHVARLEVYSPEGTPVPHYAANVLLTDGAGEVVVPFALNDPQGRWTLALRDVATGAEVTKKVKVE